MRTLKRYALFFAALLLAQGVMLAQLQSSEAALLSTATAAADS